tara:strand:+ start:1020 stop:1634 length:615 start_codon:yes stop_codon:yes gene_type:complete
MNATEILSKVKTLLGVDPSNLEVKAEAVTLEELTLENGTTLTAEKFEAGEEVFIQTEDEKVPMPIGEYELEDNRILIVKTEGMIEEIKNSEEVVEEVQEEQNLQEEEQDLEEKEEMGYATKEELTALAESVEEVKEQIQSIVDAMGKREEEKEEMAKQEELSKPAAEGIKHSPEVEDTKLGARLAPNSNQNTTYSRVLRAITNN